MDISRQFPRDVRKAMVKAAIAVLYGTAFRGRRNGAAGEVRDPRRILLINGFHIGDVVIATSVIPILRRAYPRAEIGFATGSWSQMVVRNHPDVTWTHCVDHWKMNRANISFFEKIRRYRKTRRVALREIRALRYDVAISLFTNFPDFLDLTWAARIPVRIGFSRSVFSSLATDLVHEPESPFVHQGARLAVTLRALPIDPAHFRFRRSTLPPDDAASIEEVRSLLGASRLDDICYCVIHMGKGSVRWEFPRSLWRELAERLSADHTLLFTGRGERECNTIVEVIKGLRNCVNACDRLTWGGFVAAVRNAEALYGVDSMAGHVAGAVGTKCIIVSGGAAGVARWRPEGQESIVITNHVPCAPCLRAEGCAAMTCMKEIRADDLVRLSGWPREAVPSTGH